MANMEPNIPAQTVCRTCHQAILPTYYFCPNCGTKVNEPPLSTSISTQAWIYAFSIVLPVMCFIFVTKWPGVKYYKSPDEKAKQIGTIAWALIIISTVVTVWLATVWTNDFIQSQVAATNADLSADGL